MINKKPVCAVTGGHLTPGLAVIEELKSQGWEVLWIGIDKAIENENVSSLEAKVLPSLNIPFYTLKTPKIDRQDLLKSIVNLPLIFKAIVRCLNLLKVARADAVLSFGSFVSVPVSIAAWIFGIPIVVHEQTSSSGLANRAMALIADKIALSYKESKTGFPREKSLLTGNPIRSSIFTVSKKRLKKTLGKPPVLYITGGSRGSQAINRAVKEVLPKLLENFKIIHQTGDLDFKKISIIRNKLSKISQDKYTVSGTFSFKEVDKIFSEVDIVVSRAGANTVSEIAVLGVPVIFIPLPNASWDEQTKNAKLLANLGSAMILKQDNLSGENLLQSINKILKNYKIYKKNALKAQKLVPKNAALKIVDLLEEFTK